MAIQQICRDLGQEPPGHSRNAKLQRAPIPLWAWSQLNVLRVRFMLCLSSPHSLQERGGNLPTPPVISPSLLLLEMSWKWFYLSGQRSLCGLCWWVLSVPSSPSSLWGFSAVQFEFSECSQGSSWRNKDRGQGRNPLCQAEPGLGTSSTPCRAQALVYLFYRELMG